jgi:hypothetical protein
MLFKPMETSRMTAGGGMAALSWLFGCWILAFGFWLGSCEWSNLQILKSTQRNVMLSLWCRLGTHV